MTQTRRNYWPRSDEWAFRYIREQGRHAEELARMAGRWHARSSRTDRDRRCALELEGVLHDTVLNELRMLAVRWHALADLSGGDHCYADEMDAWIAARGHTDADGNHLRAVVQPAFARPRIASQRLSSPNARWTSIA